MTPKLARPKKTESLTQKATTPCGAVFVILGFLEGEHVPFELFLKPGSNSGCLKAWTAAMGEAQSTILRTRALPPTSVAKTLKGISCNRTSFNDGILYKSCMDVIGAVFMELWNTRREQFGEKPEEFGLIPQAPADEDPGDDNPIRMDVAS